MFQPGDLAYPQISAPPAPPSPPVFTLGKHSDSAVGPCVWDVEPLHCTGKVPFAVRGAVWSARYWPMTSLRALVGRSILHRDAATGSLPLQQSPARRRTTCRAVARPASSCPGQPSQREVVRVRESVCFQSSPPCAPSPTCRSREFDTLPYDQVCTLTSTKCTAGGSSSLLSSRRGGAGLGGGTAGRHESMRLGRPPLPPPETSLLPKFM